MITGAPEAIWLVMGEDCGEGPFSEFHEVTWCEDKQYADDIKYVRADVADKLREAAQKALDVLRGEVEPVPGGLLAYDGAIESLIEALEAVK